MAGETRTGPTAAQITTKHHQLQMDLPPVAGRHPSPRSVVGSAGTGHRRSVGRSDRFVSRWDRPEVIAESEN